MMTCKKRAQQKKLSSLPFVSNRIIYISSEVKVDWVRRMTLSFVTFVMCHVSGCPKGTVPGKQSGQSPSAFVIYDHPKWKNDSFGNEAKLKA